ncbi:PREDICTED: protein hugin [Drosophila arizonae]|uniref:Protein hugin n=1 Tax=Drosophila arizonae TaxID=7263 RepID=A0ABM1Q277_DROAR|nr:PREDICTED: protein hugin [Drosophila arizonae]
MYRLSNCTLLLIAVSCYLVYASQAKALQGTNKLDLPNRISGISVGSAGAAAAAEARHKRAMGEYKELNDIIDDLDENGLVQKGGAAATASQAQAQEFDLDSMPPLAYYMLLERLRQWQRNNEQAYTRRTPRLGRSIDFQQLLDSRGGNEEAAGGQFVSRMMKKSVPFKPRLGKRAQVCGSGGD